MEWFRFYSSVLDNPKVQQLPGELFKTWVNLLALAARTDRYSGKLPSPEKISYSLRMPMGATLSQLSALVEGGLVDKVNATTMAMHDWKEFQYISDTSTPRVKRFRQRSMKRSSTVTGNVAETPPDTDTDTDTDTERAEGHTLKGNGPSAIHSQAGSLASAPDGALTRPSASQKTSGGYRPSGMSPEVGDDYRSPPRKPPEHQNELQPLPDQPSSSREPWEQYTDEELVALYGKQK